MAKANPDYFMKSEEENSRLSNQHEVIKDAMGGQLVHAPLDLTAQSLCVLDTGTADGTFLRRLCGSDQPYEALQELGCWTSMKLPMASITS